MISIIISEVTPYHWGNPWYSTKISFLERNADTPLNTYFFGSSLIYRQIDPIEFDLTVGSLGVNEISSFNLGAPATFNPQSYFLYEKFLESDLSRNTRYCFLELREVDLLDDFFLHQERTTYWQNFSGLRFVSKSIVANNQLSLRKKTESILNYLTSYLENTFHLGHFGKQILAEEYYQNKYIGPDLNGLFLLEDDLKTATNPVVRKSLLKRKKSIVNNPGLVALRKRTLIDCYDHGKNDFDAINLEKIIELIKISKAKGIHLTFILSPRIGTPELISLSRHIPKENLIDMANPKKNNELYALDYSFDVSHLNKKGTKIYSRLLAIEFADRLKLIEHELR